MENANHRQDVFPIAYYYPLLSSLSFTSTITLSVSLLLSLFSPHHYHHDTRLNQLLPFFNASNSDDRVTWQAMHTVLVMYLVKANYYFRSVAVYFVIPSLNWCSKGETYTSATAAAAASTGHCQCPSLCIPKAMMLSNGEIFRWGTAAAGGGKVVMRVWLVNGHGDVKAITANTHSWPAMTTDAAV